jgi:hypothetical protein
VVAVLDRLAGGAETIEAFAGAPYRPLATIDDGALSFVPQPVRRARRSASSKGSLGTAVAPPVARD